MTNHPDRWQLDRLIERYPGTLPYPSNYTFPEPPYGVLVDDADSKFADDFQNLLDWLADHLHELKEQSSCP